MDGRFYALRMQLRQKYPNVSGDLLDAIIQEVDGHVSTTVSTAHWGENKQLQDLLSRTSHELSIMTESTGIQGYHLNGEVLYWEETQFPTLKEEIDAFLERCKKQ